ncbi:unnamed protein product [Linum tenue]|uniref:Uncharacterized protein n=1 Tax=Linum tenue TaxID=586396 RepID=A0AAV0GVL0_9ROSI|nr:unnamed protein product [Linum tenue]CAI0376726.1 unnamed protein product [Linum tenue]
MLLRKNSWRKLSVRLLERKQAASKDPYKLTVAQQMRKKHLGTNFIICSALDKHMAVLMLSVLSSHDGAAESSRRMTVLRNTFEVQLPEGLCRFAQSINSSSDVEGHNDDKNADDGEGVGLSHLSNGRQGDTKKREETRSNLFHENETQEWLECQSSAADMRVDSVATVVIVESKDFDKKLKLGEMDM